MNEVIRINLKTTCKDRSELVNFCLKEKNQCLAVGWSRIYEKYNCINDINEFCNNVKEEEKKEDEKKRLNPVLKFFKNSQKDDLFWTRDLNGFYWICRAIGNVELYADKKLDIGLILPVKAYEVGTEVPGFIKAPFSVRGTASRIKGEHVLAYSKYIYNKVSGENYYYYDIVKSDLIANLPDFDLEELVISYIQLKENYYVLSNSIAKNSTTIKIECEFISRDKNNAQKAVVQVKGGNTKLNALDYREFIDKGYKVYLYANEIDNLENNINFIRITRKELLLFYKEYKNILPDNIKVWENIFN